MSKTIIYFLTIILCFLFKGSDAFSQSGFPTREGISVSEGTIQLYFANRPLEEVLQGIANQTGIRFKISNSLTSKAITANIQASDWESAVMELLKDFSKVEVWTSDLNLTRIHLLQSNDYLALNETTTDPSRNLSKIKPQEQVAQAPIRKKPAWKCFSLSGKRKC